MYYHVRLDRIFHDGRTDMDAQAEWDFRSLTKALAMIGRDYGMDAAGWRIQDLTEPMSNIMLLENDMRVALESSHQFVVMTFKDASPALKKYDHYGFFVVARDEAERSPEFAFSKEGEEAMIATSDSEVVETAQTSVMDNNLLEGLPMGLAHKPVVACDYQDINDALGDFDSDDARFISVGHAQWNQDDLSVKVFRVGNSGRWSRQSEEVPAQRLPYMMAMLLATIYKIQNSSKNTDSGMNEKIVASQDMDLLRDQIHALAEPLKDGFKRVGDLLNMIDLNSL